MLCIIRVQAVLVLWLNIYKKNNFDTTYPFDIQKTHPHSRAHNISRNHSYMKYPSLSRPNVHGYILTQWRATCVMILVHYTHTPNPVCFRFNLCFMFYRRENTYVWLTTRLNSGFKVTNALIRQAAMHIVSDYTTKFLSFIINTVS